MILEFDGIEFGFDGSSLLTGIHMSCEQGQVVGLLGRNGTGKSTLMKIVFGAIRADVASIRINGSYIGGNGFSGRRISYLPQEHFLPGNLRLTTITKLYNIDQDQICTYFPELAHDMNLLPAQVSGGRLRLFEVMLILLGNNDFCLLDEPFTGLSPLFIERLQRAIVSEKGNKGVILSDHLFRNVMEISDRVYVLTNGRTFEVTEQHGLVRHGYLV